MSEYAEVSIEHHPTDQGGRVNPIYPRAPGDALGYMPHFRVGPDGEYLGVLFLDGTRPIPPGERGTATIAFIYEVDYSPLQENVAFQIMEGARAVGAGVILRRWSSPVEWHEYRSTRAEAVSEQ